MIETEDVRNDVKGITGKGSSSNKAKRRENAQVDVQGKDTAGKQGRVKKEAWHGSGGFVNHGGGATWGVVET